MQNLLINASATSTNDSGGFSFVAIEGITAGAPVTLSGLKTGCHVEMVKRPMIDTGMLPLVAGRVSANAFVVVAN